MAVVAVHLLAGLVAAGLALLPADASAAAAAPPSPTTPSSSPYAQAIGETLAFEAAAVHRAAPRRDDRLSAACLDLAARIGSRPPPPRELIEHALWQHGIVEPPPLLVTARLPAEADLLALARDATLRARLREALAATRSRRFGAALGPRAADGSRMAVVALQESFVVLRPMPRQARLGASLELAGRLLWPYTRPEVHVTSPAGQVYRLPLFHAGIALPAGSADPAGAASPARATRPAGTLGHGGTAAGPGSAERADWPGQAAADEDTLDGRGESFRTTLSCGNLPGVLKIQVTGEDPRRDHQVLANFPLYCGVAPPALPAPLYHAPSASDGSPAGHGSPAIDGWRPDLIARRVFAALNLDRRRVSLPALEWDARLAAVAEAHSRDMAEHGFVGHVSPTSGDMVARAAAAGLRPPVLLENVARAYGAYDAQASLMDSPAHRANILSTKVTHAGIGVAIPPGSAGASGTILVTQLFANFPDRVDSQMAASRLSDLVLRRRREAGRRVLRRAADLDRLAAAYAQAVAAGGSREQAAGALERGIGKLTETYGQVQSVTMIVDRLEDAIGPEVVLPAATDLGVGAAMGQQEQLGREALFVVFLLGQRR